MANVEDRMGQIYRAAAREIKAYLFALDPASATPSRIAEVRRRTKTTLRALDYAASEWSRTAIARTYNDETRAIRTSLQILGRRPVKRVKRDSSTKLASATLDFYLEANRSIGKTIDKYLSVLDMARRTISRARVQEFNFLEPEEASWLRDRATLAVEREESKGSLKKDVKDHLQGLVEDGNLIEVNGKAWIMDKYADLVARTSLREAATSATLDLCDQYANDLVEVSDHATDCDECEEFEGKIYSISGKDPNYPPLTDEPPYHPNCKHSLLPTSEEAIEARKSEAAPPEAEPPAPPPPPPTPPKPSAPPPPAPAPAPAPAASSWTAATTKAEAESWAKSNVAAFVDYSKISLENANVINKNLSILISNGVKLDAVAPPAIVKRMMGTRRGRNFVYAVFHSEDLRSGTKRMMLAYNPAAVGTAEKAAATIKNLESANLIKASTADALVQHEIGHMIDFVNSARWNRASHVLSNLWNNTFTDLAARQAATAEFKLIAGTYGATNGAEFYAECFRLYKQGLLPKKFDFIATYFQDLGW
jgi:hypothetical protein